jgi:hypothetical protein
VSFLSSLAVQERVRRRLKCGNMGEYIGHRPQGSLSGRTRKANRRKQCHSKRTMPLSRLVMRKVVSMSQKWKVKSSFHRYNKDTGSKK